MKSGISIFSDVPKHFPLRGGGASTILLSTVAKKKGHGNTMATSFATRSTLWPTFLQFQIYWKV